MFDLFVQAFTTFVVTVEPVALVPLFVAMTQGRDRAERRRTAIRGTTIALIVLLCFAIGGQAFLEYLGITLPALRIAGGILLFLLAIDMVLARRSGLRATTSGEDREADAREDLAVFPLAVPLIAGPAAITAVILMMSAVGGQPLMQALVLATLVLVLGLTLVVLLIAARVMSAIGVTGINVVGRVLGILLAALATQYVIDGIRESRALV